MNNEKNILGKGVAESITEQVQIVLPAHINGYQRLFGGQLMQWMDVVAGVVARRHANKEVTTAAVDHLEFKSPAYVNNTISLIGRMTYAGNTSMEVRVDVFLEALDGMKKRINRAYFVMVALDEEQNPTKVPPLLLETEAEKIEWDNAIRRREMRKLRESARF